MKVHARAVQEEETEEETAARLVEMKVHARAAREEEASRAHFKSAIVPAR